ncbi:dyslexia-associated KIAA0319 homolog [Pelobates cultripes]|nr:dyslexia-associated KIAA0319 homolog [Pelobates cultripes]
METHRTGSATPDTSALSKRPAVRWQVTWFRKIHLFTCLSVLCATCTPTDASRSSSVCQTGRIQFGLGLRTSNEASQLHFLEDHQSLHSCHTLCCQSHSCNVFWLQGGTCILSDCLTHGCVTTHVDSGNSVLVFLHKDTISRGKSPPHGQTFKVSQKDRKIRTPVETVVSNNGPKYDRTLDRVRRHLAKGERRKRGLTDPQNPVSTSMSEEGPSSKRASQEKIKGSTEGDKITLIPTPQPSSIDSFAEKPPANIQSNDTNTPSLGDLSAGGSGKPSSNETHPVLIPSNTTTQPSPVPTSTSTKVPVVNKLVVSAGDSVEVTLPKNAVQLNAFVLPVPPEGKVYTYDWRLITHPTDYSGEMEGKYSQLLKLSKLTAGLYEFKVIVEGENSYGEGFVNVTVKPEPRVNQPPVAIVSPRYQEISLPTTSTVIDGSQSTDDEKIVSYEWEELKGPLREEKVSAETPILKLTNLVPGNYTFSFTVTDSDGAKNSTTASLTVNKAVDYPPVANAGANQVITLPKNSIVLFGNLSTDDHGIVSYEWSLSPSSKGNVMEMQGVRTSTLQLSALQEGDYTFQLTVTDSAGQQSTSEVTVIVEPENNKPPEADAGPDKELTLPVDSTRLDGSRSTDDQKIVSYLWEKTQGPDGVKIMNDTSSIAVVSGLQVGNYEFTLTVKDERDLKSQSIVSVIVKEEMNKPPIAKIAGNIVITLPSNTAELDGSKSWDDKGIVSYQWERDEGSPAAGDVLNNSDRHAVLFLSNLVEGTYTFHLKVMDAKGESDTDRATVEVKQDAMKNNLVEMILDVSVSQLTERQKGMFMRQIAVLLGLLDSDIIVQKIQLYTEQSTKVVFFVKNQPPHLVMKGHQVAWKLRNELRKQQSDFLIFKALEIDTFTCQLNCSLHGHCNSFTKLCVCDPFWMENFIRRQFGDGESNCEWSVLYVIITSFLVLVALGLLSWCMICFCRRKKSKLKRKSRYKILEGTDDQESIEMKSGLKTGVKLKAPVQNTSLMHSESELDSDDNVYTWSDREKGKLLRPQNGSLRNGQASQKNKNQREELL